MLSFNDIVSRHNLKESISIEQMIEIPSLVLEEAGIKWPATISLAIHECLKPTKKEMARGQSYDGRLWDFLMVFRMAVWEKDTMTLSFTFRILTENGYEKREIIVTAGSDDDLKPRLTFRMPSCDR